MMRDIDTAVWGMRKRAAGFAGRLRRPWRGGKAARAAARLGTPAHLEPLEDRCLMSVGVTATTTAPFISEFLAVNNTGLKDEDGNRPDWIELYNPTPGDVNLAGYFLTDDAAVLNKWAFPSVTLPSGGFLTVFASGKNRAVSGSPLHTNFTLDSAGEYLGLIAPDGATVVSDFSPTYPAQVADVSYGISVNQVTTPLIRTSATARTLVPTGDIGTDWQQPTFDDSTWLLGKTGVGYENETPTPGTPGFRTRMVDVTGSDLSNIAIATSILDSSDGTAGGSFTVESDTNVVKSVVNMGPGGIFSPDDLLPNGMSNADQYVLRSRANVTIPAGTWTINVNSDDGFRLKIPGVTFTNRTGEDYNGVPAGILPDTLVFGSPRGAANTFGTFTVPAGGLTTTLQLDFYENFGGDSVELAIASGTQTAVNTTNFQLLGDTVKGWAVNDPDTVGAPNYRSLLGTDIGPQMFNKATTAYVRVPFSVAAAGDVASLRLQMKYDDGFVAYVNGVEVARKNAPSPLAFNSAATANQPDTSALVYESFSVPPSALRTGTNVLAVQMLNASAGSSDLLMYPELQGLTATVGDQARYFGTPTPGAINSGTGTDGVVRDTKFSVDRGFFDAPFQVTITSDTADAQIRYTTNGSTPTATTGIVYTGPITIDKTTTLRAAAFKTGWLSTNVDTETYIFLDDVIRQSPTAAPGPGWPAPGQVNGQTINYGMDPDIVNSPTWGPQLKNALKSIPTFSIVTDTNNLFNPTTGIYVNPSGDERAWERPASLELINPDGSKGFQIDMGLRIRGGYSRSGGNPKHAFRFFFRSEYDGKLRYPLFGTNGTSTFDGIDLRTTENYSWAFEGNPGSIFMRDQFSRDTQLAMGQPAERGNWYHLYIDGQYWGLYNTDERAEANYGATYFGGQPEDYDVVKVDPDLGYNIEATDGNLDAWNQLYQALHGTVTEDVYQSIQGNKPDGTPDLTKPVLLDVDNLIDYMLVIYYGGNLDAAISNFLGNTAPNNFFSMRNRNLDARMGFKFFAHDSEHTLLDVNQNRLGPSAGQGWNDNNWPLSKSNPQYFFQRLWSLPSFKQRVADHVQKFMVNPGGALTPAEAKKRLTARKNEIFAATIAESARWGDSKREPPITQNDFNNAINAVINNYMTSRTGIVINQLRQWGIIPNFNGPVFNQQGGQVPAGFQITLTPATGTPAGASMYYTLDGTDPRLPNGTVSPSAILYTGPITVNDTVTVFARTQTNPAAPVWSGANIATFSLDVASLRVTELMYNPAPPPVGSTFTKDDFEYIEIQNTGPATLDLEGVKLDSAVDFVFPVNFNLAAGGRAIVVKNRAAFESRYGNLGDAVIAGTYSGSLSDGGELVRIVSPAGQPVLSFTYSDGWYPQTDGEGFSLTVVDPAAATTAWNLKSNWKASGPLGGTPGAPDNSPNPGAVVVNEVLSNPQPGSPGGDFVELRNTTGADLDVGGWYLTNDDLDLKRFRIPAGTILPAGGYVVFNQAALGFDVSAAGGEVTVSAGDATGALQGYRDSVHFDASDPGVSFGQFTKSTGGSDFVAMTSPTPGAANAAPLVGPVVINELMFYPGTGQAEYIELRNLTGSEVVLNDPANPTGPWKFVDGIDYVLPEGAAIPAFGYALVVPIDPAAFRTIYDIPPAVPIFGPYQHADGTNTLSNTGENLTLYRPAAAGYALADRLNYLPVAPWPAGAAGTGTSIVRAVALNYGNEPANWLEEVAGGSPGRANVDFDGPSADVVDVTPDPRTTPVDSIRIVFNEPVRNLDLADLALKLNGGPNLLTGSETLSTTDNVTWTLSDLTGLTTTAGAYTLTLNATGSGIVDWAGNDIVAGASDAWRVGAAPTGRVVGRYVYYNNSRFDGGANGAADDAAIATDKQALLPGQTSTFANYTSYSRGINGVMIDASGLLADLTAADFVLQVGNNDDPASWAAAPAPLSITRRAGAGTGSSDRVTLTFADGSVRNKWLRVTVLPTARTGLASPDVFYFGNLCGEIGNDPAAATVNTVDLAMVRRSFTAAGKTVPLTNKYDFNRDGKVNALDLALARIGSAGGTLTRLTAPAASGAGVAAVSSTTSTQTVFSQSLVVPQSTSPAAGTTTNDQSILGISSPDVLSRA